VEEGAALNQVTVNHRIGGIGERKVTHNLAMSDDLIRAPACLRRAIQSCSRTSEASLIFSPSSGERCDELVVKVPKHLLTVRALEIPFCRIRKRIDDATVLADIEVVLLLVVEPASRISSTSLISSSITS